MKPVCSPTLPPLQIRLWEKSQFATDIEIEAATSAVDVEPAEQGALRQ